MEVDSSSSGREGFLSPDTIADHPASPCNEQWLRAIAASPGIAIGPAVLWLPPAARGSDSCVSADAEWERYTRAVSELRRELLSARAVVVAEAAEVVPIIDSYLHLLEDASLEERVRELVMAGMTAEQALQRVFDSLIGRLRRSADVLFQERGNELEHFLQWFLAALRLPQRDYTRTTGAVVVAPAVTPSEVVLLHRAGACGLVTAVGGITSHTTILARSLQLPAVIGVRNALGTIPEGELVIVDGYTGTVVVRPTEETRRRYERHRDSTEWRRRVLRWFAQLPAETIDGRRFHLRVNIAAPQDVQEANLVGAEGVGLLRTEALFLQLGRLPNEEEQFQWYQELAQQFYPDPVTIRLFDLGGDKYGEGTTERNPALGMRGVRFLLRHPEVLQTQLRAIVRVAAIWPNIRVLVPMVTSPQELTAIRQHLWRVQQECIGNIARAIPVGAMVETPAAALCAAQLAEVADFFSIGTNDLVQFTLAVDREHGQLAELFEPFHPAVWQLIGKVVEVAHQRGLPVGICGELAAHAEATELLVGLGVDELSTIPAALIPLKHRIRRLSYAQARARVRALTNGG
ncbi:MAG: phosphoenolpyruvate--protein phosphotransferase [Chlorobiota bacterium]